jgi:hypothetical protein
MDSVALSLQDLIFYFRPPEEELEHEEKQTKLRSLKNRQNLFQEEVSAHAQQMRMMHCMLKIFFPHGSSLWCSYVICVIPHRA